jgi:hypothetical protein
MKKFVAFATALVVAVGILAASPAPASADSRCGGVMGIQLWENTFKGGKTIILCSANNYRDLSAYKVDPGCSLLCATWNDRVSSYEVFNLSSLSKARFYYNKDFNKGTTGWYITTTGSGYVPDLRVYYNGGFNDQMSSISIPCAYAPYNKC